MKDKEIEDQISDYERRLEEYNNRHIQIEIAANLYALLLELRSYLEVFK